ncbi:MAG: HalOD1 output domain-containing protein [Natrialbaceae archaeon]
MASRLSSSGAQQPAETGTTVDGELTVSVVEQVALARGESPMETSVRLHEHADIEALDSLLDHADRAENAEWEFEFTVEVLDVTVESDGSITVE